jgi:hypothetical protein
LKRLLLAALLLWGCDDATSPGVTIALEQGVVDQGLDRGTPDDMRPGDVGIDAAIPDAMLDMTVDQAVDLALDMALPPEPARRLEIGEIATGTPIDIEVPEGARSVLVQARGRPDGIYAVVQVIGPDGALSDARGEGLWRSAPNPEVAVALWPPTDDPAARLAPGAYQFQIAAGLPVEETVEVDVYFGFGAEALRVNAFLPPVLGFELDDPSVVQMALTLEAKLGAILDVPVEVELAFLADDAPADLEFNGTEGDYSGLSALGAAAPDMGPGLDLYLMGQVVNDGNRQSGFAGGLPAPIGLRGTRASVVAIRTPLLADFPIAVADLGVHELGHALGLFHTTEPFADRFDPILDTPECPEDCDRDGDGVLLASECGRNDTREPPCQGTADNFMFWTLGGQRDHTRGQRTVARRHPILSP